MIHKVHPKHSNNWTGMGKPKVGDLLIMYNPVFGNDDYTEYYKTFPKDTVYVVVSAVDSLIIRPVTKKDVSGPCQSFTCSAGYDKYFKPYDGVKGALKGLTIY